MKKVTPHLLLLFSLTLTLHAADIQLHITDFRNNKGIAAITLFNQEDGFPAQPDKACAKAQARIKDKKTTASFTGLTTGTYAISVLHDEDRNNRMDTNWLGIPREGVGSSNNPRGGFGPPDFEDAAFRLTSPTLHLHIQIDYIF